MTMGNGVAERRNRTLIEAARTMLADAKLPVTFWVEAVNTACYVQNKVLVNKSQNKTPYELFNDNLGKFEVKGDEGYFIGYFMSSKAFRVFNKRTKRVEENLHVDFLENKPIEKRVGPNWLFDIDSLTYSMNYVSVVVAGTNSTNFSGTKEAAGQDVKKDVSSLRYIVLPNWFPETYLETSTSNAQDACNADAPESSGNSNPTATSINSPADHMETLAGTIDQTLFIRRQRGDFILVQVYVDDIIFGSSNPQLSREFEAFMHEKFQMSAMGELNFFLGLQILQKEDGIFLYQDKLSMPCEALSKEISSSLPLLLAFYDYHNMIAILEKYEHNVDFHQIVDFVEASHIRVKTSDKETKILATVDGKPRTTSESSIRRNLKLKDEAGISSLPDAELFEDLTLMGDSPTRVPSLAADEGSMQKKLDELTALCTSLDVVPTTNPIFTTATESNPYTKRKGKEKMVESDTPKK
nr:hypothetical protein [Tanacetum cinerariifolium]